jgi:hypothetical protein
MRIARSSFQVGGIELEVPSLHPAVLEEIAIDMARGDVERVGAVAAIAAMLTPSYPWVTARWLDENLDAETVAGLLENLAAQAAIATAARRAPAPAAEAGLPN